MKLNKLSSGGVLIRLRAKRDKSAGVERVVQFLFVPDCNISSRNHNFNFNWDKEFFFPVRPLPLLEADKTM
jgi:hypothetical protein